MLSTIRLSALTLATAVMLTGAVATAVAKRPPDPRVDVGVDFAAPQPPRGTMIGFLHSLGPDTPQNLVAPLRPGLWRGEQKSADPERVRATGARYQLVLSDLWGYPGNNYHGRGAPYDHLKKWESFVRNIARANRGRNFIWDIWNEPDSRKFWHGTRGQFFETYSVAAKAIRSELGPEARIGGPSLEAWDPQYLRAFLDHCVTDTADVEPEPEAPAPATPPTLVPSLIFPPPPKETAPAPAVARCSVNVLSWHELASDQAQIPAIADHVRAAREQFVDNPVYDTIGLDEVYVNENLSARDQFRPGELLGQLHYLEQGGADGAAHACWNESDGKDNCYNDSLDGLLTPKSLEPRAVWFASKKYSDGVSSRVASTTTDPYLVALASHRAPEASKAQVLLGRLVERNVRQARRQTAAVRLAGLSALPFLKGRGYVRVRVSRIPNSGERAISGLDQVAERRVRISGDSASLDLGNFRLHEGYVVTLSRAGKR